MGRRKFRILSIDGGGIRGLIPAEWLRELNVRLRDARLRTVYHHFDIFAGTSTGAIVAAAMAAELPPDVIRVMYQTSANDVFQRRWKWTMTRPRLRPKYRDKGLREILCQTLVRDGEPLVLGDLKKRTVLTAFDPRNRRPFIFDSADERLREVPLWRACVASAAAPTYFAPQNVMIDRVNYTLLDGGIVANNPTCLALSKAIELGVLPQDIFVLSLGTGRAAQPLNVNRIKKWGEVQWALPLIGHLFDGGSNATDSILRSVLYRDNYVRFQVSIDRSSLALDNVSKENLEQLAAAARGFLAAEGKDLMERVFAEIKTGGELPRIVRRYGSYQSPSDLVRAAADNWDSVVRDVFSEASQNGHDLVDGLRASMRQASDSSYADGASAYAKSLSRFEERLKQEIDEVENMLGAFRQKLQMARKIFLSECEGSDSDGRSDQQAPAEFEKE